jgi:hypothetical protein
MSEDMIIASPTGFTFWMSASLVCILAQEYLSAKETTESSEQTTRPRR